MDLPPEPKSLGKLAEDLVASLRRVPNENAGRGHSRRTRPMNELMDAIQVKHGLGRATPEQALRDAWPEIVGSANASYSHAVRIDRCKLVVHASHPVVREELFLHRKEILERVQKIVGPEVVRLVHFSTA